MTSVPSGLNLTNAVVQLQNYSSSALGAGTITATINPSGQLSWTDTNQAHGGLATQGTYVLDVTADVPHVFQAYVGTLDEADEALDRAALFLTQRLRSR